MFLFVNGKAVEGGAADNGGENLVCFAERGGELPPEFARSFAAQKPVGGNYFESRSGFDYISLKIPHLRDGAVPAGTVEIAVFPGKLCFLYSPAGMMDKFIGELKEGGWRGPEEALHRFFVMLTEKDMARLERLEEKIARMEDEVLSDRQKDFISSLSKFRKKLLMLKRYYESLTDMFEDFMENRNNLFSKDALRHFEFQANRVERLYRDVLNLRDYLTQVREAYQNEMDISLNKTMKLFTVITVIFLPLTLVVGWYGMNVVMPEYGFAYSYPIIIAVSIIVVVASIIYFRKNKWF